MQLLDVKKRCWSDEILNILGIEKSLLPKVYESADITGYYNGITVAAGGAKSELWRIMMADVFNVPTSVIPIADGVEAALGAAILAGTAAGVYTSVESVCKKICVPSEEKLTQNAERYNEFYEIYKSIYPSVKDIFGYM